MGQVLEAGHLMQPSVRVRDVPDLRTIRYYTTLGLLDRPLDMRGRTAYYGWRHVWQLLAIKRLQLAGVPLVEIQQRLTGAEDRTLKKLAA
ncbi:MAG TPA: MerR family transcriptional regulator [Pirellulales bacterium]|nr:MerR family transcriptional regulator [Pirellulales bacterium]